MSAEASPASASAAGPAQQAQKRIHSLIVDTGPLIKNEPALSTLLAQADELYTIPAVLAEIKVSDSCTEPSYSVAHPPLPADNPPSLPTISVSDRRSSSRLQDKATRSRVETTLLPFLKLRSPKPDSIRFITDFSRRTGDLEVLSKPDIHLLALCYELEVERNGGDWRVRRDPRQKGLNGKPPATAEDEEVPTPAAVETTQEDDTEATRTAQDQDQALGHPSDPTPPVEDIPTDPQAEASAVATDQQAPPVDTVDQTVAPALEQLNLDEAAAAESNCQEDDGSGSPAQDSPGQVEEEVDDDNDDDDDDDSDGWITPSNLKKHQAKDAQVSVPSEPIQETLQAALLTSDFAMQNVALRINLKYASPIITVDFCQILLVLTQPKSLVSPSNLTRIKQLKTWVLRCYGCFTVTRQMDRQFCPKCGQATLTRTSSSTDSAGNMRVHLKKNFQYNKRGNVYSVPKPVHGSANGKLANVPGGGKNHWSAGLILAEDQKEYSRKEAEDRRARQRDLMDEDYLPNLLSGERTGGHGRIRVGAGRNVNAKKRR